MMQVGKTATVYELLDSGNSDIFVKTAQSPNFYRIS